jgi:hypothetical protein
VRKHGPFHWYLLNKICYIFLRNESVGNDKFFVVSGGNILLSYDSVIIGESFTVDL